jgi:hypothetical protein
VIRGILTIKLKRAILRFLLDPGFYNPFPAQEPPNLRGTPSNHSSHLIAHCEAVRISESSRYSEDRTWVGLDVRGDVQETGELKPVRWHWKSGIEKVSA